MDPQTSCQHGGRLYHYVGPEEVKARVKDSPPGTHIASRGDILSWVRGTGQRSGPDGFITATFVIDAKRNLLLADRRSEHVACASGGPVLSAGEMFFLLDNNDVEAAEVSNQSTGYCPEPESWPVVASVLDRASIAHPGRFTLEVLFRRCEKCNERNVVKDGFFVCSVCGAELPAEWNFS